MKQIFVSVKGFGFKFKCDFQGFRDINDLGILIFFRKWLDFEYIMLGELSQIEKDRQYMILFICGI